MTSFRRMAAATALILASPAGHLRSPGPTCRQRSAVTAVKAAPAAKPDPSSASRAMPAVP